METTEKHFLSKILIVLWKWVYIDLVGAPNFYRFPGGNSSVPRGTVPISQPCWKSRLHIAVISSQIVTYYNINVVHIRY